MMSLYDIEKFDPPPDPDLICCICQCVLYKAVESPCRHVFCQACIERWLSKRHTCPTCRKRTKKEDLKPVLPLVQNMLNRLLMRCDYFNNGCVQKIMLEQYELHMKDCGYEMKTCRFVKCGQKILKMNIERHENELCEHRESICEGECGLMIALSDKQTHNCVTALKAHIEEKNRMIETLKAKLQELNNLSQTLNDQLEQLRQQIDDNRPISFSPFLSSSSDSVVSDMSDDLREVSMDIDSSASSDTYDNADDDVDSIQGNNNDRNDRNEALDVVQQVERTVVSSLIDLSSRLERVRNQMRSVLDRGVMDEDNNLNDDVHIPSDALNAIVNNTQNVTSTSGPNPDSVENSSRVVEANTTSGHSSSYNSHENDLSMDGRVNSNTRGNEPGLSSSSVTEFSPSYYYSNSENSDQEWDPDSTNFNQNEAYANGEHGDSPQGNSLDHDRSTQRWVRSVLLSPVHIIESQPPRSPSESESSYSSIPSMSSIHSPRLNRSYNNSPDRDSDHASRSPYFDQEGDSSFQSFHSQSNHETSGRNNRNETEDNDVSKRDDDKSNDGTAHSEASDFGSLRDLSVDRSTHQDSDWCPETSSPGNGDEDNQDRPSDHSLSDNSNDSHASGVHVGEDDGESSDDDNSDKERCSFFDQVKKESFPLLNKDGHSESSPWSNNATESDNESSYSVKSQSSGNASIPRSVQSNDHDIDNNDIDSGDEEDMPREPDASLNHSHDITISSEDSEPSDPENGRRTWKYETKPSKFVNKSTATVSEELKESDMLNSKDTSTAPGNSHSFDHENNKKKVNFNCKGSLLSCNSPVNDRTNSFNTNSCNFSNFNNSDDKRNVTVNRKRKHESDYDVESGKRSKYSNSEHSQTHLNQTYRHATPSVDINQSNQKIHQGHSMQSTSASQDKNTQSLNVKIDLSLINYSGNILTQPISQSTSTPGSVNQTSVHVRQPRLSSVQQRNTRQSLPKPVASTGALSKSSTTHKRQLRASSLRTTCPDYQQGNNQSHGTQQRQQRETLTSRRSSTQRDVEQSDSTGTHNYLNELSDDSDSESDKTWEPHGEEETDVTVSDEGEPESDTDYEVQVPKSTADLLNEYASDETDESWTCEVGSVD